jgi:hypothetical protein
MTTQPALVRQLKRYAAATATCADRYAYTFYPLIRDGDEKFVCCVHGGEDMEHYLWAAEVLRGEDVDLTGLVEQPVSARGLEGADVLGAPMTWTERAAFSAVFERALLLQLRAFARGDHAPAAQLAASSIPRETRHVAHGVTLLRAACGTPEGTARAQAAVDKMWPVALAVLDTADAQAALADACRAELVPLGLAVAARMA